MDDRHLITGRRSGAYLAGAMAILALCGLAGCDTPREHADRPKLVLLIVVDQLRGDFLDRYGERLEPGGLRRLVESGVHYREAHFRHGVTATAPSHTTIVTGAPPAVHGLVGNNWVDPETGQSVYCVQDERHRLLGEATHVRDGVSPALMEAETIGDVLAQVTGGESRVFGVSLKDRGAILLAGRAGKAFWYSRRTGRFVTSDYYYREPPGWLEAFNTDDPAGAYRQSAWTLSRDAADYRFMDRDDQPWERDYRGLGRVFPHELARTSDFYSALRFTPFADQLTLAAVAALMEAEAIGQRSSPDLLAVSLSATDYVGHAFGPDSLEAEDNMFRLDRLVAELLVLAERQAGPGRTLVILTSDHGIPSAPEYLTQQGEPVDRIDTPGMIARLNRQLRREMSLDFDPILRFYNPSLFLDLPRLVGAGIDTERLARRVAALAAAEPGVESAYAAGDLQGGPGDGSLVRELARASIRADRAGQVYLVQTPGWHLHALPQVHAAMHSSPHPYDTHVPIVVMGPGIAPQSVSRPVGVESLAASLAAYLDLPAPAQASDELLPEMIPGRRP